jgi:hypothetical protein
MQGIFILTETGQRRPKSKKEIKEILQVDPTMIRLERTAWIGDEYDGLVSEAPDGDYAFVGPDPYLKRAFYGRLVVGNGKVRVK